MIHKVKLSIFFFFVFSLVSCINKEKEKAVLLNRELETVPLISTVSDSLLREVCTLSSHLRVDILLNTSSRIVVHLEEVKKQEELLLEILAVASKKDKKKILQRLVVVYQKMDQLGAREAISKGLFRCEELETQYSLSKEEDWEIKKAKVAFWNKQGYYKKSISILYNLLEEHRDAKNIEYLIQDLYKIATYFVRLGDLENGLLLFNEAYLNAVEHNLFEQHTTCLSAKVSVLFSLKRYNDIVNIFNTIKSDSIVKCMPSFYPILANCYLQLHQPDSARFYLYQMNQKSRKGAGMVYYCNLAETYISENREDSATLYLNKALDIFRAKSSKKLPFYFMYVFPSYASLLKHNGKIKQAGDVFQLLTPLMQESVEELERLEYQIDALGHYSDFCRSTNQYKKAAELLVFRDSIQKVYYEKKISLDSKHWVDRFEIQELTFDNEKKQEEINNSKRISSIIVAVSIILLGFTVITVCMYRLIRKQNKKLREHQAQMELLLKPEPVVTKKREPLTPQEQLFELAAKTVKSKKLFLNSALTLDELAEKLGTNRSTLSACINQCSKSNFNQWINNYRIDYIQKNITATSTPHDLCVEAGFKSYNTFITSFKERLGCTPSEYIKAHKYETLQEDAR